MLFVGVASIPTLIEILLITKEVGVFFGLMLIRDSKILLGDDLARGCALFYFLLLSKRESPEIELILAIGTKLLRAGHIHLILKHMSQEALRLDVIALETVCRLHLLSIVSRHHGSAH